MNARVLLKILMMTTSDNDSEALTAIRKVNAMMKEAGITWEKVSFPIKVETPKPPPRSETRYQPPHHPRARSSYYGFSDFSADEILRAKMKADQEMASKQKESKSEFEEWIEKLRKSGVL